MNRQNEGAALQITPQFEGQNIRITGTPEDPWFVAKDVCGALGIQNVAQATDRLDGDEVCQTYVTDSIGRQQLMAAVSESGLYTLILRSDKPQAKPFRKWVTREVLPAIRKPGNCQATLLRRRGCGRPGRGVVKCVAEDRGVRLLKNFSLLPRPVTQKYVSRPVPGFGFLKLFLIGSLADLSP